MIFIVLGMHKSGTTLLARALHESGIVMGQDFPPGVKYAEAKYEARWVQEINDEVLGIGRRELSLHVTSKLLPKKGINKGIKKKMEQGINEMQRSYTHWGFKDPRAVLTYQYWRELLPYHRLVIVYRDPLEVWKRYSNFNHSLRFALPFKTWCDYNRTILRYINEVKKEQAICVNFEHLLSGSEEWERFRAFVGADLKDIRDSTQSINRLSGKEREALRFRMLMAVAGGEAVRIFRELESLRANGI